MPDQIDLSRMDTVLVDGPYGFQRLERYCEAPTDEYWDDLWKHTDAASYWSRARQGKRLGDFGYLYLKHLNKGAQILEAGCGLGQVVISLRALGYDCHGLDFAEETIANLKSVFPDVPFHLGDIRALPLQDGTYDGYVSLGVIEHFHDGQLGMLQEASRILKPGGFAFVSVPFYNGYRQLRTRMGTWKDETNRDFFEACLSLDELKHLMDQSGFDFVEAGYSNPVMTFVQETPLRPLYRPIEDVRYVRGGIDRVLHKILPLRYFSHMVMAVGQKR
jgi:SAM-dependent methyltransferase